MGDVEPAMVEVYLAMEPSELVATLKDEAEAGVELAKFLLGFCDTITYDGIVNYLTPYKGSEKWGEIVERILNEEGKVWVEQVMELVKEIRNE